MDRISIADAAEDGSSDGYAEPFGDGSDSGFGDATEDEIVVELDRGLRSANLASAETMLEDPGD